MSDKPHIAILGAGPTGLDAALAAAEAGYPFTIYEAAPRIAGHVHQWRHVSLFTPWSMNVSARMRRHLAAAGREVSDDPGDCPTGGELIDGVLRPVAELPVLAAHLRLGTRVLEVGREGLLKHEEIGTGGRARHPFRLLLEEGGRERVAHAGAVLDCTGNAVPNALGAGGILAPGERAARRLIDHQIPDFAAANGRWDGRTLLLVGGGHSAQTAARDFLPSLAARPGTRLIWAVRGVRPTWGAVADDPLPARGSLTDFARGLVADPPAGAEIRTGRVVESLAVDGGGEGVVVELRSTGDDPRETVRADRILALTGQVGEHRLYRQLQIHECYATSGPMKLAAALLAQSGGGGDCLDQTSLGPETLRNPEPGFFLLGQKSYGRRGDYLMRVGFEQVDEVFQLLEE